LWVTGVRPGEVVSFLFSVIGEGTGLCAAQYGALCADFVKPALLGEVTADAVGTTTVIHTMPAEMLPRQTLVFQAVIRRGPEQTAP